MNLVSCRNCDHQVPAGAILCPRCGIKFPNLPIPALPVHCKSCGGAIRVHTKLCPHCGTMHPQFSDRQLKYIDRAATLIIFTVVFFALLLLARMLG